MNKSDLIRAIAEETGLTQIDSKKALEAFIIGVSSSLKKSENVKLVGFGTLKITLHRAIIGRNPKTGQEVQIKAKKVVSFRIGRELSVLIQ
jgi:DNA-binding protein HU-beta